MYKYPIYIEHWWGHMFSASGYAVNVVALAAGASLLAVLGEEA